MNRTTHKQAIKWIDRRLDGLLTEKQSLLLDEHLRSCDSCSAYAAEMNLLPIHLQKEFHARWDEKPGPSQKVMQHVTAKARRIPMTNRISSGFKLFVGAAALVALGFVFNFFVSQLSSAPTPATSLARAEDRLLAFASNQNGNYDIYTIHADGSELKNLTNNPAHDTNPFWSPDGQRIAFQSDRNGSMQIYLMDADGSNVVQVTDSEREHRFDNLASSWSPDGKRLIVMESESLNPAESASGDAEWMLYAIDVDGQHKTPLTQAPAMYAWSPDSEHIAFMAFEPRETRDGARIHVVDVNGGNLTDIPKLLPADENLYFGDFPHFSWSPDGQSIYFDVGRSTEDGDARFVTYEVTLDGETLTEKTVFEKTVPNTFMIDSWDLWGKTVLITDYGITSGSEPSYTWLRSDGTQNGTLKPFEKCKGNNDTQSHSIHARSVKGNLLIGVSCSIGDLWFYWANSDGTLIKQLLDSPVAINGFSIANITWSPDEKFIAFNLVSSDSNSMHMYILNIEAALKDPSIQPLQIRVDGDSNMYYWWSAWQPTP